MSKDKVPETVEEKVEELVEGKQKTEEIPDDDILSKTRKRLQELKEVNDAIEAENMRAEEERAKKQLGGKSLAGQPQESQEDKDEKEAADILSKFS